MEAPGWTISKSKSMFIHKKTGFTIAILLTIILIYIMADVWGEMPKSQTDAETIEEAIIRLIEDHNDEVTAHAGDEQSLGIHRKNSIIDHPELSIVDDKYSRKEWKNEITQFIADYCDLPGRSILDGLGRIKMRMYNSTGMFLGYCAGVDYIEYENTDQLYLTQDWTVRMGETTESSKIIIDQGSIGEDGPGYFCIGFQIIGGKIYTWKQEGATESATLVDTWTQGEIHNLTAEYEPIERTIKYKIDGTLVDTKILGEGNLHSYINLLELNIQKIGTYQSGIDKLIISRAKIVVREQ